MRRSAAAWAAGGAVAFAIVLLYATLSSRPAPPPADVRNQEQLAERACTRAVRERLEGARFPFPARVVVRGPGEYQVSGSVDASGASGTVRRNYECVARPGRAGRYPLESLRVWQSH